MNNQRKKERGYTNDYFLVFEIESGEIVGRLINLTTEGLMLINEDPVEMNKTFKCRMILPEIIEGSRELYFDLQSRWCQYNKRAKWHETGYEILNKTEVCSKVLQVIMKDWMAPINSITKIE